MDSAAIARTIEVYVEALRTHREVINRLNVYPVPDGDTGTNMLLTVESVLGELAEQRGADMASACKAISHGSLMGARGNSGVILSQILRGLCDVLREVDEVDAATYARALRTASDAAREAVMKPVEGTILTVIAEAATAAEASRSDGLLAAVESSRRQAGVTLDRTPDLLPVLKEAGVVDAGGAGLVLLFDALLAVIDSRPLPEPPMLTEVPSTGQASRPRGGDSREALASDLRYEVMFFLEAPDETIGAFKGVWSGIGDSIVVVGGDSLWNCHIHTDDIGAAIEAALDSGRPRQIRVTDLFGQVEEERWVREADMEPEVPARSDVPVMTAIVAVATGEGVSRIFYSLGVQRVVKGGQTMNPSTAQLLAAVEAAPSEEVIILPNNTNIIPVAEQVDSQTAKIVRVVPTRGVAEGFASLLSYDPEASGNDNAKAMTEAAEEVVAGEVTRAIRDSTCELGPISAGDWIGLCGDGISAVAPALEDACVGLLDALIEGDHELVTIIEGDGATAVATRHLQVWLEEHHPGVGTEVHRGGQPLYPYLFGIE